MRSTRLTRDAALSSAQTYCHAATPALQSAASAQNAQQQLLLPLTIQDQVHMHTVRLA